MSAQFAASRAIAQRIPETREEHRMKTIATILLALTALSALPLRRTAMSSTPTKAMRRASPATPKNLPAPSRSG